MLKNLKWASGSLKKVPTIFRLELLDLEFNVNDGYFSIQQHDINTVISTGTSINVVSVTKRGLAKSSILKQVQAGSNGQLVVRFNESFNFKASLFYDSNGRCIEKILRLNINRVCRIDESMEFSTTCIGYVVVNLHDVTNTGNTDFRIPLVMIDCESATATLVIKLTMATGDFGADDTSSIGSDLSFMHKEVRSARNQSGSKRSVHRVVGGSMPEAGTPGKFSSPERIEMENLLTELSIVRMHLDRAVADKETSEARCRDLNRELQALQTELKTCQVNIQTEKKTQREELDSSGAMAASQAVKIEQLESALLSLTAEVGDLKIKLKTQVQEPAICTENIALMTELQSTKKQLASITSKYNALTEEVEKKRLSLLSDSGKAKVDGVIIRKDLFSDDGDDLDICDSATLNSVKGTGSGNGGKGSLFSTDDVDVTFRAKPTRTSLFNDDVVELLKDRPVSAAAAAAGTVPNSSVSSYGGTAQSSMYGGGKGQVGTKKPSLFQDEV
jgi:regulator of replication initiation timing